LTHRILEEWKRAIFIPFSGKEIGMFVTIIEASAFLPLLIKTMPKSLQDI
jgi:hypothetical protein